MSISKISYLERSGVSLLRMAERMPLTPTVNQLSLLKKAHSRLSLSFEACGERTLNLPFEPFNIYGMVFLRMRCEPDTPINRVSTSSGDFIIGFYYP